MCDLFTRSSHYRNISVILITQNLFRQVRYRRDISVNYHYAVALKNVRDKKEFAYLAQKCIPKKVSGCITPAWKRHKYPTATSFFIWHKTRMKGCGFEPTYSRKNILRSSTPIWALKLVKSNCHALHVTKTADPKLRKALITNSAR